MAMDPLQDQLSTAAGQEAFLRDKLIRPMEDKYGVQFQKDPGLSALTRALEDNPTIAGLRAAFESLPDLSNMFPEIDDQNLAALQNMFKSGSLPDSLQAILDALARLNTDRAGGLGGNFDQPA